MTFLTQDFFARPPEVVARELIGATLVISIPQGLKKAKITETEAYLAEADPAAHHARYGRTPAREALYQTAGTLYIHSMRAYWGMDIVTEGVGIPSSVLIRGAVPLEGFTSAIKMDGPGKLCQALGVDKSFYGMNVCDEACLLRVMPADDVRAVKQSTRVGLTRNTEAQLRFYI